MATKLEQAARQALGALVRAEALYGQPNADIQTALREALAEQQDKPEECAYGCPENMVCDYCQGAEPVKQELNWGANKFMPHEQPVKRPQNCGTGYCSCIECVMEPVKQEPVAWHHPECKGECIACLIERCVKDSYGTQGLDFMLRHINAAPVQPVKQKVTALLNVALEALVYHTEQTRPIHKTDEAISQIQNFLDKGATK